MRRLYEKEGTQKLLASLLSILIGLAVGALVVTIVGLTKKNIGIRGVWDGVRIIFAGILSTGREAGKLSWGYNPQSLGNMLFRATPLVMTGLSVAIANKTGLFNIGAAGQYCAGAGLALFSALAWNMPWWACILFAMAGGALLDIGVYGINFALMHFGTDIERVESSVKMLDTGVDAMETITIFYKDGRMAVLTHSIYCRSDRKGIIHGDKGYIVVENINNPQSISVYDLFDNLVEQHIVPRQINGYEYEFLECAKALESGWTESKSMPMADTVYIMEFMDSLRRQWGMVYPREK